MPDVTYDKKHWLLYVHIKPNAITPFESVTMADSEQTIIDSQNPLEIGQSTLAHSEITVVVDYDAEGDLAGVEILDLPPKKPA